MQPSFENLPPIHGQSFRCFDRRDNGYPDRWHRHPEIELTLIPRGSGARLVGDHMGTYADLDLVLLGPNLPHTWASDSCRGEGADREEGIVTQFRPHFLGNEFFKVAEMLPVDELLQRSRCGLWYPPEVALSMSERLREMVTQTGPKRLLNLLSCLEELSKFPDAVELATAGYVGPTSSASESRMQVISEYAQQSFTDASLNTGRLAEKLQMNPSAFCRFFKRSTGLTPSSYINQLRVGFACRQLLNSDRSVLQVCHESGFASTSYFNETFRKLRGISPRQFRSRHSKIQSSGSSPLSGTQQP